MDIATLGGLTELSLPDDFELEFEYHGLFVRRLRSRGKVVAATFEAFRFRGTACRRAIATLEDGIKLVLEFGSFNDSYEDVAPVAVLRGRPLIEGTRLAWERVVFQTDGGNLPAAVVAMAECRTAWKTSGINYRSERLDDEGQLVTSGLRLPQSGALHAIAAHWTTGTDRALVVMPTGTGKTEVMIAAAVEAAGDRVLVIVPSDALRLQTADRFSSYSVLKKLGTVGSLPNPVIGILSSRPTTDQFAALEAGPHPVIASAARELLNKADNERSGVLSTAMSFLGLYRDPVVARVTRRCDWRIRDLVGNERPTSLYLVVPPSDINRTKPLIRLILNQIGRRLTEDLTGEGSRHRLLLMLDEFPALGRLDFFESALAYMAGYGLKSFLIAQSLNQIEKAYGPNNAILDNCHVRVSFATNDERTAKRISDALGTATEMRAMKNYAGHRLAPWLGHLMVSRSETARQLLTPGEVMQLPTTDQIVMIAGTPPILAKKARYYEDARLTGRVLPPPTQMEALDPVQDDWSQLSPSQQAGTEAVTKPEAVEREPAEALHLERAGREQRSVAPSQPIANEFEFEPSEPREIAIQKCSSRTKEGLARQASLDPNTGLEF